MESSGQHVLPGTMRWCLLLSFLSFSAWAGEKPNIIHIMVDDAGIGDFGCYGGKEILTPNIDRLAAEGLRFTCAYSGNAVCAPTRDVLMTGCHPGHCVFRANRDTLTIPDETVTVAEAMKAAGYATGGFGKWGIGLENSPGAPEKQGFDVFFGYYHQVHAHSYFTDHLVRNSKDESQAAGSYSANVVEDETLKFIEANKDKPFFVYAPWTLPHGNYEIPADDPALKPYAGKPWGQKVRNYAAMITKVDTGVGRVMAKLKDLGLEEKTLVIFSSDNGTNQEFVKPLASNGGLRGFKRHLTEGGLRMPMIARWPGTIKPGATTGLHTGHLDFFATCAELAGSPVKPPADGISILPTLLGEPQEKKHAFLYWEIYEARFQQAVRMGKWKGLRLGLKVPLELYDLEKDPGEKNDVASAHPERVKEIEAIMAREHQPSKAWKAPDQPTPPKKKQRQQKQKAKPQAR